MSFQRASPQGSFQAGSYSFPNVFWSMHAKPSRHEFTHTEITDQGLPKQRCCASEGGIHLLHAAVWSLSSASAFSPLRELRGALPVLAPRGWTARAAGSQGRHVPLVRRHCKGVNQCRASGHCLYHPLLQGELLATSPAMQRRYALAQTILTRVHTHAHSHLRQGSWLRDLLRSLLAVLL